MGQKGPRVITDGLVSAGDGRPEGEAAKQKEAFKVKQYGSRFDITTTRFYAFAMESYGCMGTRAIDALRLVAKLQCAYWDGRAGAGMARLIPYGTRFRRAVERVSAAQQEGNAYIVQGFRFEAARRSRVRL